MKIKHFFILLILSSSFFLSSCILSIVGVSYFTHIEDSLDEGVTINATIVSSTGPNGVNISIAPIGYKPLAYTLFYIEDENPIEIDSRFLDGIYSIEDETLTLNTIPSATFNVTSMKKGIFYVAVEVDNGSYMDEDGVHLFTKTLFTNLIKVL